MKNIVSILLALTLILMSFAIADTYTLDEVLPSIVTYTDEELQRLYDAVVAEQSSRAAATSVSESATSDETDVIDETPYTEREDYIERTSVQKGDKSDEVKAVQEQLIALGFLTGNADGDFGKKSESAVMAFQKANGLEETGIADSITQYVMYSDFALDKDAYDSLPIATGDGWQMIKEYQYKTSWYNYYCFVLKNVSGYNAEISCNVVFYDANHNIVGVSNASERACENGYETFWVFSNDIEFEYATVDITMTEETWYKDGGQSCVELSASIVGNKAIITAKNNGKEAVDFLEYHVLFMDENGNLLSTGWGYLTDDDNELKPGKMEMREESYFEGFSDVKVYALGRIDK